LYYQKKYLIQKITLLECNTKTNAHPRTAQSFVSNPKTMMNFWIDEDAAHVIQHIYDLPHITLEKMRLGV